MSNSIPIAQPKLPIFFGNHYDQWVMRMRTILTGYGLWEYIEYGYNEFNGKTKLENNKNDGFALSYIQQGVSPEIFQSISHATKAKEAWDIIRNQFGGNPVVLPHNSQGSRSAPALSNGVLPHNSQRSRSSPALSNGEKARNGLVVAASGMTFANATYGIINKISDSNDRSIGKSSDGGSDNLFTYANDGGSDNLFTYANDGGSDNLFTYANDGGTDNLFTYANDVGASGIESDTAGSFVEGIADMFVSLASWF